MNTMLKKTLVAAGVATALAGPSTVMAIPGITFDQNGALGGGEIVGATRFNWTLQSTLAQGLIDETVGNTLTGTLMGHGRLDTISLAAGGSTQIPAGVITYQYSVEVNAALDDAKGGAAHTLSFNDNANYGASNFFNVYFDPTPGVGTGTSGLGFGLANGEVNGDQQLILSGKISTNALLTSSFQANPGSTTAPITPLDGATPNTAGPWSIGGSGSINLDIDVCDPADAGVGKCSAFGAGMGDTVDTDWFKSDISSFTLDLDLNGGIQSFFNQFVPPARIHNSLVLGSNLGDLEPIAAFGNAARYGNDFDCGGGMTPCDMIFQGQNGLSRFNHTTVPEPTTLALLGLGASAFGFSARRRQQKKDA